MAVPMDEFLAKLRDRAIEADVFGDVEIADGMLRGAARDAEEAWYRLERIDGLWHVVLVTPNRWLSESIEADLMHTGNPIEELTQHLFLGTAPFLAARQADDAICAAVVAAILYLDGGSCSQRRPTRLRE